METVKVKKDNSKGYHIINLSDFVQGVHELFDAPVEAEESEAMAALNESMDDLREIGVVPAKRGRKSKAD